MENLCKICESKVNFVNDVYVCEEGHISEQIQEIDVDTTSKQARTILSQKYTDSQVPYFVNTTERKKLLLFVSLFEKLRRFCGIKSKKLLELFITFFSDDEEVRKEYDFFKPEFIFFLIYFSKRIEEEQAGNTLFLSEYFNYMSLFEYNDFLMEYKSKLEIVDNELFKLEIFNINLFNVFLRSKFKEFEKMKTQLQKNIVNLFYKYCCGNSKENLMKYFDKILEIISVKKTDHIIFYFNKYINRRFILKFLYIPEIEICVFLRSYLTYFSIEINTKLFEEILIENFYRFKNEKFVTKDMQNLIEKRDFFFDINIFKMILDKYDKNKVIGYLSLLSGVTCAELLSMGNEVKKHFV